MVGIGAKGEGCNRPATSLHTEYLVILCHAFHSSMRLPAHERGSEEGCLGRSGVREGLDMQHVYVSDGQRNLCVCAPCTLCLLVAEALNWRTNPVGTLSLAYQWCLNNGHPAFYAFSEQVEVHNRRG